MTAEIKSEFYCVDCHKSFDTAQELIEHRALCLERPGNTTVWTNNKFPPWFFRCSSKGEFEWNPELIKAFVKQVKEEMKNE